MCSLSQDGSSALHLASRNGHIEVVKVLRDASADINLTNMVKLCVHMCVLCFTCKCILCVNINITPK